MQVSKQMKQQKSGNECLKPVMMLEIAMNIIPFHTMSKLFNKVFTIPVVSFTNLGVIDKNLLNFGSEKIKYAYLTGAVKYVPYFQISVSTYDDVCTLSCNLYGTEEDRKSIDEFLTDVKEELMEYVSSNLNRYN